MNAAKTFDKPAESQGGRLLLDAGLTQSNGGSVTAGWAERAMPRHSAPALGIAMEIWSRAEAAFRSEFTDP